MYYYFWAFDSREWNIPFQSDEERMVLEAKGRQLNGRRLGESVVCGCSMRLRLVG